MTAEQITEILFFQKDVCRCVELREKGSYETCLSEQARIW